MFKNAGVNGKVKLSVTIFCILMLLVTTFLVINRPEKESTIHLKGGNSHFDWNVNPESASAMEKEATFIVEVKYTGNEGSFKEAGASVVKTKYKVDVVSVLKGNLTEKQIDIVGYGGEIDLEEYIENSTEEEIEQLDEEKDIRTMSKKNLQGSTFEFVDNFGIDLKKNDTAIVFLNEKDLTSGQYPIMCAGLGLLEKGANQKYKNNESNLTLDNKMIKKIAEENK